MFHDAVCSAASLRILKLQVLMCLVDLQSAYPLHPRHEHDRHLQADGIAERVDNGRSARGAPIPGAINI